MSTSLPSREVYSIDIPEVDDFAAKFRYNFFVPDESVNDSGGIPERFLVREADDIDASFIQFSLTRAPRFVSFEFTPPKVNTSGRAVLDEDVRRNVNPVRPPEFLIAENVDKIMTEDQFSSDAFVSVNFHDGEIQDKIYDLVSGSIEQMTDDEVIDREVSQFKAAQRLSSILPSHIKPHFLTRFVSSMTRTSGARFFSTREGTSRVRKLSIPAKKSIKRQIIKPGRGEQLELRNKWYTRLNQVKMHVQINSKMFGDIVNKQMTDPNSPFADDLHSLHGYARKMQDNSKRRLSVLPTEEDFKTLIPFVDVRVQKTAHMTNRGAVEIVGFMIDKTEMTQDGEIIEHDPIIIEKPDIRTTADYKVKYGSRYKYEIRTIAQFTLPAVDDDTDDIATIKALISSRPSNTVYVDCREKEAPPPPADLNFTWNYETDKLLVHWCFPPNSQRDIKKFQVFRRASIDEPFELMKQYDFDDSLRKYPDREDPDPEIVEYITSPATFWIDDDFDRNIQNQTFIYATACIDAHGFTSNYSAQFEIGFDVFKNKLTKKLISHSGAPKPYPNLYLERDAFVDTIRVSGPCSKRMRVYFNPEYYFVGDDDERYKPIIATNQRGGSYKLQIINLDNQKSQQVTINIDDKIRVANRKINFPQYRFGNKRRLRSFKRSS